MNISILTGLTEIDGDGNADDLAAYATATGTADYVVQTGDLGTSIVNIATVDSDQTDEDTDTNTVPVPESDLTITKTNTLFIDADGSGDVSVGDTIRYTYEIENTGNANLTDITLSDDQLAAVNISILTGLTEIDSYNFV